MNADELREKIYEYLGLELGSLASESGNDWERAKKEVIDDYKREQINNISENQEINLKTIDKTSTEFNLVLNSNDAAFEFKREHISQRTDLNDNEISILIDNSSKEILINLTKNYKLSENLISKILDKSVYLVIKYILERQSLTEHNLLKIKTVMDRNKSLYTDLYKLIN